MPGLHEYADLMVKAALAEDIGSADITTDAIVGRKDHGTGEIIAKEDFIAAGLFLAEKVFKTLDKNAVFKPGCKDGDRIKKGKKLATVEARLDALLSGERVALNFMQRLSGIATLTKKFVEKMGRDSVKILDTRKTTPCLRIFEKYAVKAGGGHNHRFGLFDCVMIKDNHIKAAHGINNAVASVRDEYGESLLIEVEAKSLAEVREAVDSHADIIMLDNMGPDKIKKSLKIINNRALVEVSGGVNLGNIRKVAKSGVDFISIGALTHSARSVDISMEMVSLCGKTQTRKSR